MQEHCRRWPALLLIILLGGCHPPSQKQWEMVFTAKDGKARLITVSTVDLFSGIGMHTEKTFPTHASCRGAWHDLPSGRLATVEQAGDDGEVVRVYNRDGNVLSTYPVDADVVGRVCNSPCLARGGRRIAFLGDLGAVFWTDVGDGSTGNVRKLWQVWGVGPDESSRGRRRWSGFARCYWVDESTLAVACQIAIPGPPPIWRVDLDADRARPLNNGHLAGVLADSSIVATSYYSYCSRFQASDAETGVSMGTARVGCPYCKYKGISPCGEYILYHEPGGLLPTKGRLYIHHLESGRRAVLRAPVRWKLGSWSEIGSVEPGPVTGPTAEQQLASIPDRLTEERTYQILPTSRPPACLQFLTGANGADDVEIPRRSTEEFILTDPPAAPRLMHFPCGLAAREGVVYVCDEKGHCICRLDYRNRSYSLFGVSGPGRLRKPVSITIDTLGHKFVVDSGRQQIVVFGPRDEYERALDLPAPDPVDVAVIGNELYVLHGGDADPSRIVVLDQSSGEVIRTFGGAGEEPGEFDYPYGLSIDSEGYVYVSEAGGRRLQKLTRDGKSVWVKAMPQSPWVRRGLECPLGVRTAPDGTVFVADGNMLHNVHRFGPDGQVLLSIFGSPDGPDRFVSPRTLAVDATSLPYFKDYIHEDFNAEYVLFITSARGPYLVNIYAFGSFPEGHRHPQ